ncbi:MAG: acyltransferase family protein [Candidatus Limnocylindrales bacterium]
MTERPGFRPDLEGLRAVAVALVVLYHARVPLVTGGYVGVDVFFVLSGFLITGLLIRELSGSGRVDFAAFYARRARRLLPASALVLIVTIVLAAVLLPPVHMPDVAADTVAAGLYVSNLRFAVQATDYLGSALAPSPVLHFWSLGVEEQFYLFWPALLALAAGVAFRAGRREDGLRRVGIALGAVLVASLLFEVWLTGAAQPWAFFSLPARAWELALGGLLSLPAAARLVRARLAPAMAWAGLAMVVAAGFVLDDTTVFPGVAVLLPTVGSALVIAAGLGPTAGDASGAAAPGPARPSVRSPAGSVRARPHAAAEAPTATRRGAAARVPDAAALLSLGPMRSVGRISYSLNHWHRPILMLPAASLGVELALPWRLLLAAVAVGVAALSQRFVEDPIRHGRLIGLASRRSLAMAGTLALAVALVSMSANTFAATRLVTSGPEIGGSITDVPLPSGPAAVPRSASVPAPVRASEYPPPAGGATAPGPQAAAPGGPAPGPSLPPPPGGPVPADLAPSLANAAGDLPITYSDGCHLDVLVTALRPCVFGDPASPVRVVLFGDSHAAQWFAPLQRLATQHHWRLESITKSACTPVSVTVWSAIVNRTFRECDQWRQLALARIAAERPALVVVSTSSLYLLVVGGQQVSASTRPDLWAKGLATTMRALAGSASHVVMLGDTPRSVADPAGCLSLHLNDSTACTVPFPQAVDEEQIALDAAVAAQTSAAFVDPTAWVCHTDPCPAVYGRFLIYRDQGHLTKTYAGALATELFAQLPAIGP